MVLSPREIMSMRHSNRSLHITEEQGVRGLTKTGMGSSMLDRGLMIADNNRLGPELAFLLWIRVGPLTGLRGLPPYTSEFGAGHGNFFSVFHMPNIQSTAALATYVAQREAIGSPVETMLMPLDHLEYLIQVSCPADQMNQELTILKFSGETWLMRGWPCSAWWNVEISIHWSITKE